MLARRPLLAALAFALAACARVPGDAVTRCEATQVVPAAVKTDILFVIDDSGSMKDEQDRLSAGLGAFIQTLASAPIANEFQIGVTNTSVERYPGGSASALRTYTTGPSSGTPFPSGTLVAIARDSAGAPVAGKLMWTQASGFDGPRVLTAGMPRDQLVSDFSANVLVGVDGSPKEQPFRAARLALEAAVPGGTNEGFLRSGARLAIVFLSDEDDCSDTAAPLAASDTDCHDATVKATELDDVAEFASYLRGPVVGEPRDTVVAAIVGVDPATLVPATCSTAASTAYDKADRHVELLHALGAARTRLASICDDSFQRALEDIAGLLVAQSMPLQGTPADWRMLAVGVERGTETIPCTVRDEASPDVAAADVIYTAPRAGQPATLTFQNGCRLQQGDRARVDVICAG